jgi:hypothetical protein
MKKWKYYIQENRAVFDDQEPYKNHQKRFEERLNRCFSESKNKQAAKSIRIAVLSIAATIVLFIWIGVRIFLLLNDPEEYSQRTVPSNTTEEFFITNDFYKKQMNKQIADIQCKLTNIDKQAQIQLKNDLQNILDENNHFVEQIQKDDNRELAIFYLLKHYRINLQTLQFINKKLEKYIYC